MLGYARPSLTQPTTLAVVCVRHGLRAAECKKSRTGRDFLAWESSEHRMSARRFFRYGLGDVPVFDDFAVLVEAEDVDDRFAALVRGVLAVDVDDNEVAFRHDALDVGARLRVFFEERRKGINECLAAVGHARIVLDVGLGDAYFSTASSSLCWLKASS